MALTSLSPQSSRAAIPPASSNSSVPPSLSESNQTSETPAPSNSSNPSNSSVTPQSPPSAVPDAPPPSTPEAMPPLALSPPLPQISPPPSPSLSPPPPSPVTLPQPPPLPVAHPPAKNSPAPPDFTPPPPFKGSPPEASSVPQVTTPPPPLAVNPTPPSPVGHSLPPSSVTPHAPMAESPANTHPLPIPSPSSSPPVPSAPSVLSLPPISSPAPPNESSSNESSPPSPLPTVPTEKPTARSTTHDPTTTKSAAPRNAGGLSIGGVVAIGIAIGFFALSLALLAVWSRRRRKRKGSDLSGSYNPPSAYATSQNSGSSFMRPEQPFHQTESTSGTKITYPSEPGGVGYSKSGFTYEELDAATSGFSASNLLGEGGFGCVYKGILADGREVAVKQLKIGGAQGEREFKTEVEIISRVHHRHLVSLVGYCIAEHERLLVYDYVPNNTLHYHLHGEDRPIMDWVTRVKVAAGAARGLAYLHEDCWRFWACKVSTRCLYTCDHACDGNFWIYGSGVCLKWQVN